MLLTSQNPRVQFKLSKQAFGIVERLGGPSDASVWIPHLSVNGASFEMASRVNDMPFAFLMDFCCIVYVFLALFCIVHVFVMGLLDFLVRTFSKMN